MKELETVVLTHNIEEYGLRKGDVGAVVHVYLDEKACEVEFVSGQGETVAVLTLSADEVRPLAGREILHAREFGST